MTKPRDAPGPFRASQLRSGDPYELSHGHPVRCAPTGRDLVELNGLGFAVLATDPAVERAGVDAGLALSDDTLRAPDIAVNFEGESGPWATRAPLVVEYAGRGQDEAELRAKIPELHAAGTRWVWVVRLVGPRRVEVYEAGQAMKTVGPGESLTAPGVLQNPVPVEALYDRDAALAATTRNLVQRAGFASLDEARDRARAAALDEGAEALRAAFRGVALARGWSLSASDVARLSACRELSTLSAWITRAASAPSLSDVW